MKPTSCFPARIVLVTVALISSICADARPVRSHGGGRGYTYRPPNVDAQFARWHRYQLIPTARDRVPHAPVAAPFSFGGESTEWVSQSAGGLKRGALTQREAIKMAQRSLRGLGYYRGLDNGTMSRSFEQALRRFQADSGSPNTGVVNRETLEALGLQVPDSPR